MPKYDYRCGAGHTYEKREGFDAPATQPCQECGLEARRLLNAPAIVFKGSGWYVNDSRKSTAPAATDTPGAPAAPKADAATPATESKPAAPAASSAPSAPAASTPPTTTSPAKAAE